MQAKIIISAICAAGVLAAGCGSSSGGTTGTSAGSSASTVASTTGESGSGGTVIGVTDNPDLGPILTDAKGNTVYLFEADETQASNCTGQCATVWPPLTSRGNATAGQGADASLIGTFKRDDGTLQVAYDGHPLYIYKGDSTPGDTTGNGLDQFGAEWYAVTPDGSNAEGSAPESPSDSTTESTTGSADYGY